MSFSEVSKLKDQIANETDATAKVALYEKLVPMLREPAFNWRQISDPVEREKAKLAARAQRTYNREHGLSHTGKPLSDKQKSRLKANMTDEQRAEAKAKAVARSAAMSPEEKQARADKLRAAQAERTQRQQAMLDRLAKLEAMVAGKAEAPATPTTDESKPQRGGRR